MRIALVKFGDVVLEYRAATSAVAPEFEGGNRYVRDFLAETPGSERLLLSLGQTDSEASDDDVVASSHRLSPSRSSIGGRVVLFRGLRWMKHRLMDFAPDMIVCLDTGPPAAICAQVAEKLQARLVIVATTHISGMGPGRALRAADAARALGSPRLMGALACSSSIAAQVSKLTHPGVPVSVYHPDYSQMTRDLGDPVPMRDRVREAVFVGRLTSVKGSDRLCEIAAALLPLNDARLVVIGGGPDLKRVRAEARRSGVEPVMRFDGTLSHTDVMERMRRARIVIVPSRSEGVAKVAIESILAGTPVVAFHTGGLPDAVSHEVNGMLIQPGDVTGFARAVVSLMEDDDAWYRLSRGVLDTRFELGTRVPTFGGALGELLGGARV